MTKAPEFIRVKRRREEGSVHALLIDQNKRVKRGKYIFKLRKTVNENSYEDDREANTPLLKLEQEQGHHFVLEQHKRKRDDDSDDEIRPQTNGKTDHSDNMPLEISQMVNNYLKLQSTKSDEEINASQRKKPSKKRYLNQTVIAPIQDYVYDIYRLEEVPEEEFSTYDTDDNVGFVKIVNKYVDLLPDDEEYTDNEMRSDDEDSNEENYYQNDYPEDEDDDRSVLFGSEGENIAEDESNTARHQQSTELQSWGVIPSNVEKWNEDKSGNNMMEDNADYNELFEQLKDSENVLYDITNNHAVDMDMDNTRKAYYDDEDNLEINDQLVNPSTDNDNEDYEYERNSFFPSDQDNPLAQHRDRIFGELQRKINEQP